MPGNDKPPTGLARRRQRLSDAETEQRMLRAAIDQVNTTGMTVSLEHISFEDVIRDAGVSRSAVYRRWPYKDLFFSDLLKELARHATPATDSATQSTVELFKAIALDHLDWLATAQQRHDLYIELFRQGALRDFDMVHSSIEWRTYIALHATFLSLPDGELRSEVHAALAASEQVFITRVAQSHEYLATLLGYRVRPESGTGFETVASLALATMRGLAIMALSTPDIGARRHDAAPFGTSRTAQWSTPALGIAGVVLGFVEPDPDVEWTPSRLARIREALASSDFPSGPPD